MKHYLLKSASFDKLEQIDVITEYFDKVDEHIKSIKNSDIICSLNYQESLSQDQRKLENMEEELAIDSSLNTIIFLSFPLIAVRTWTLGRFLTIGIVIILLTLMITSLPVYVNRKRGLARFMLTSYLDVYTVAEGTEYTEREGEPKL